MKKYFTLFYVALNCLLVSCAVNVTEEQIIGTYTCDMTEHIDEDSQTQAMDVSLSITSTYKADRSFTSNGEMSIGVQIDEDGYSNYITLIFEISITGQWQLIGGNKLLEQPNAQNVNISYKDMKLKTTDEEGWALAAYMLAGINGDIESMRQELASEETSEIVSFSDRKMVLKGEDGTRVECISVEAD